MNENSDVLAVQCMNPERGVKHVRNNRVYTSNPERVLYNLFTITVSRKSDMIPQVHDENDKAWGRMVMQADFRSMYHGWGFESNLVVIRFEIMSIPSPRLSPLSLTIGNPTFTCPNLEFPLKVPNMRRFIHIEGINS